MRKYYRQSQQGISLFEITLVLGFSSLLLLLALRMYQSLQTTEQLQQVKYNIDQLLQAAGNYQNANCASGDFSPSGGQVTYPPDATSYFAVSIPNILLKEGYLTNWYPTNAVVDPGSGDNGYVVQLNPILSTIPIPVNACVVLSPGTSCLPITPANLASPTAAYSDQPTSTIPIAQAQVVAWQVQVAVSLQPQSKVAAFALQLGADCTSGSSSPGTVDPCSAHNASQQYAVWSRMPSIATVKKNSVFTTSMQLLKQYNLQYTHDPNFEFNSGYSTTVSPMAPVYYLCGG